MRFVTTPMSSEATCARRGSRSAAGWPCGADQKPPAGRRRAALQARPWPCQTTVEAGRPSDGVRRAGTRQPDQRRAVHLPADRRRHRRPAAGVRPGPGPPWPGARGPRPPRAGGTLPGAARDREVPQGPGDGGRPRGRGGGGPARQLPPVRQCRGGAGGGAGSGAAGPAHGAVVRDGRRAGPGGPHYADGHAEAVGAGLVHARRRRATPGDPAGHDTAPARGVWWWE